MNDQKNAAAQTMKALIPLGALGAVVAGCGGGGGMSAALPHQQPSGSAPATSNTARTTAMLTITIPARGAKSSARKRAPKYISQGSAAIGVSVGTTGQPAPSQTFFALPTPGPSPMSTTLPVGAPVGNDTVSVNIYDAMPSATASPNLLSTGTTTATIGTGSPAVAVQALGVAAGVTVVGPSPNPASVEFFENHGAAQSVALTATAIDADGYFITGALASPVPLQTPSGVSVSPATITAGGATALTATYAALQNATGGAVSGGLPLDTVAGSSDNYDVLATQYLFVMTTSGSGSNALAVIDPIAQTLVGVYPISVNSASITQFAVAGVAGCSSGETAVVATLGSTPGNTIAVNFGVPGTASSPTPADITSTIPYQTASQDSGIASDASCGLYSTASNGVVRYSGFGSTVSGSSVMATGWNTPASLAVVGSTLYGTLPLSAAPHGLAVQSLPVAGGTATNVGTTNSTLNTATDICLVVGGSYVYSIHSDCSGSGATYIAPTFGNQFILNRGSSSNCNVAVAPNGTMYVFGSSSNTSPAVTISGSYGAVMADGRYLAAGVNTGGTPTVQLYSVPSALAASPVPVGTPIPLTGAQSTIAQMAFPH